MHWNLILKNRDTKIIFFDSDCLLCLWSVRFVLRHDKIGDIFFAGIQSNFARENLSYDQIDFENPASIIYSKQSQFFLKSDAVFEISKNFGFILRTVAIFRIVPKPIRDWLYDWIAANRFRIFGKPTACYIPPESISHRFL
jgi:predicted DCC family thiol-disulfide oxidoreductase YuxK